MRAGGWRFFLMSEDTEFTVSSVLAGEKIGYCPSAVFYDEQPVTFKQSWDQRLRWSKGFYQIDYHYGLSLLKGIFTGGHRGFSCYDMFMTVAPGMFLTLAAILINAVMLSACMFLPTAEAQIVISECLGFIARTVLVFYLGLLMYGAITTATVQQVSTVFFVDLLLRLIRELLLPLVYLYIGLLTAAACLPENRLGAIAEGLKKLVTWVLTTALLVFTVYLSVVRIISGSADSATVKVAKAAISGVVPVVGGIIADASETVLAGAGMLKNTIGVFGMLAILAACAYPFLQLGVQYLLYKGTAYLASVVGAPGLCKLIDGLGGAFGLILGMTGSCALLLLISVLASVGAVTP